MDFPIIYFWAPPQNPTKLFTGSAQIVRSVEDGKTLIKIEKVSVKASHFPMAYLFAFTFLVGILSSSTLRTFWAEPVKQERKFQKGPREGSRNSG